MLRRIRDVCLMGASASSAQIRLCARELAIPGLYGAFEEIVRDASKAYHSRIESFAACPSAEVDSRTEHLLASRIKTARLPAAKTIGIFDFSLVPSLEKGPVAIAHGLEAIHACLVIRAGR